MPKQRASTKRPFSEASLHKLKMMMEEGEIGGKPLSSAQRGAIGARIGEKRGSSKKRKGAHR